MEDLMELANNEIKKVEVVLDHLGAVAAPDLSAATIALLLIQTEFSVAQAKADAWAIYQRAKASESRVEASVLHKAAEEGVLEGRNAEERKRQEAYVTQTNPAIVAASDAAISARNMNDCVANAHITLVRAIDLLMEMVKRENAE